MASSGFYNLAAQASGAGQARGQQAMDFLSRAWAERIRKEQEWQRALANWKQRRAMKKAEDASTGGKYGKTGAGIGGALGLALAIPTGGASLAILPALGASAGGQIGGAFDQGPGQLNYDVMRRGAGDLAMMENPLYKGGQGSMTSSYNPWYEAAMQKGNAGGGDGEGEGLQPMSSGQKTAEKIKAKIGGLTDWKPKLHPFWNPLGQEKEETA